MAKEEVKVKADIVPAKGDLLSAHEHVRSTHTSELVIVLCGPVGSPLHRVADSLKETLEDDFGYQECNVLKLSDFIEERGGKYTGTGEFGRIKHLISEGDDLREQYGPSVLAELAISRIVKDRQAQKERSGEKKYETRRVCHIVDSVKNQDELDILRLVYREMLYFIGVFSPLEARVRTLEKKGMSIAEIYNLIDQDSGEEFDYGQTVRKTFPDADFFLRIDKDTDTQVNAKVLRFLNLILGTRIVTPTYDETAMYMGASAAGNSACLSRQVGAAVTDESGAVLAVGWNDVPKTFGGLYMTNLSDDPGNEKDQRCWNKAGGMCFNDSEKKLIADLLTNELIKSKIVTEDKKSETMEAILKNSKIKNLIEFSRSVHAEMHAIIQAGQQGYGGKIKGGKLFCTTYPCHSCARHIIASGIKEVYYIEPYRKSLAIKLHDDAITENESDITKVRIIPFEGVAPSRYLSIFRVKPDSRKEDGKLKVVQHKDAEPKMDKSLEALPTLEAIVVRGLRDKNLIPREDENDDQG